MDADSILDSPTTDPGPATVAYDRDRQHLELLAIFHYILAAFVALLSCIFIFHFGLGVAMLSGELAASPGQEAPPAFVGWLLAVLGGTGLLAGWVYAACLVLAGRNLKRERRYTFCLVIAALACTIMPIGTVLGVFTILVLLRPSVHARFAGR